MEISFVSMSILQAGPTVPPCSYELRPGELSDTLLSLRACTYSAELCGLPLGSEFGNGPRTRDDSMDDFLRSTLHQIVLLVMTVGFKNPN